MLRTDPADVGSGTYATAFAGHRCRVYWRRGAARPPATRLKLRRYQPFGDKSERRRNGYGAPAALVARLVPARLVRIRAQAEGAQRTRRARVSTEATGFPPCRTP